MKTEEIQRRIKIVKGQDTYLARRIFEEGFYRAFIASLVRCPPGTINEVSKKARLVLSVRKSGPVKMCHS